MLSEENLTVKKFNGKPITVTEFVHYVRHYEKILTQSNDSDTMNIFEVNNCELLISYSYLLFYGFLLMISFQLHVRATSELAQKKAFDLYSRNMKNRKFETLKALDQSHNHYFKKAMELFRKTKISGSEDIQKKFESDLKHVTKKILLSV